MKTQTLEKLIWVLIYGGLLTVGLGVSVRRSEVALGEALLLGGAAVAALGLALIFVRSRMKATPRSQ